MKNIIKLLTIAMLFSISSCSEDDKTTLDMGNVVPATIQKAELSKTVMDPSAAHKNDVVFTINWNKAQFPVELAIKQSLLFAEKGTNFQRVASFELPIDKSTFTITDFTLNSALYNDAKLRFDELVDIECRILTEVKKDDGISTVAVSSSVKEFQITIYEAPTILSPQISIGGEFQAVDGATAWNYDFETGVTLTSPKRDNVYTGYVYFNVGSSPFKVFDRKDVLGASSFTMSGLIEAGADNTMKMKGATSASAVYFMTVDVKSKTINAELKTDWIGDPKVMSWAVIGDALGGWDHTNQSPLIFNKSRGVWEGEFSFKEGPFKFKKFAPDNIASWAFNYGKTSGALVDKISTAAEAGADNIETAAGTFKVILDIRNPDDARFSMIKK